MIRSIAFCWCFFIFFALTGSNVFAVSGSWSREVVGPNINLEGQTYTSEFEPLGNIPPNAIITAISWDWSFNNERSDTIVQLGNSSLGFADISDHNVGINYSFFDGGDPSASIFMSFRVPGDGTVVPTMLGKRNTVNVSWKTVQPESIPITGPTAIEVGVSIELNGFVEYATSYDWSTEGDCSIDGASDESTVTINGGSEGECTISREACDSYNNCVIDTHNVIISGKSNLVGILQLLLL